MDTTSLLIGAGAGLVIGFLLVLFAFNYLARGAGGMGQTHRPLPARRGRQGLCRKAQGDPRGGGGQADRAAEAPEAQRRRCACSRSFRPRRGWWTS